MFDYSFNLNLYWSWLRIVFRIRFQNLIHLYNTVLDSSSLMGTVAYPWCEVCSVFFFFFFCSKNYMFFISFAHSISFYFFGFKKYSKSFATRSRKMLEVRHKIVSYKGLFWFPSSFLENRFKFQTVSRKYYSCVCFGRFNWVFHHNTRRGNSTT